MNTIDQSHGFVLGGGGGDKSHNNEIVQCLHFFSYWFLCYVLTCSRLLLEFPVRVIDFEMIECVLIGNLCQKTAIIY